VRLVAAGYSNKEIAYQTNLSMSAVGSFLQRALEKLHLTSRSQLITLAGLLGVPE
jgi:DNA-binding NarL/FixJ family response regulator